MRWGYLILGWLFFGLGLVGIPLPLIPTVGPWILATYFFARSNPRMAAYIREHPRVGPPVSAFLDHGVISRRGKMFAVGGMLIGGTIATASLWGRWWILPLALIPILIGIWFVLSRRETPKD